VRDSSMRKLGPADSARREMRGSSRWSLKDAH
jgi:hypothetical protein